MVKNVGVMSLEQTFVENRKNYAKQQMDTASASPFTGRSKFLLRSGFCFGCLRDVNFCQIRLQLAGRKKERNEEKKNVDFTRFGMRSQTPTKLGERLNRKTTMMAMMMKKKKTWKNAHKSTPIVTTASACVRRPRERKRFSFLCQLN